jgi:SAM-dependent methyltransferase
MAMIWRHVTTPHNSIYTESYYDEDVEAAAKQAAPVMAEAIVSMFYPKTIVDLGCGTGVLLEEFRKLNCKIAGLEYSDAGLSLCEKRNIPVRKFNIEKDKLDETFDVAVSFEVAEHLSPWVANRFVDLLCQLSSIVVMSGATPGQSGRDHINEQPHSYWIEKFQRRGYQLNVASTDNLRSAWQSAGIAAWYYENVMCFIRHGSSDDRRPRKARR